MSENTGDHTTPGNQQEPAPQMPRSAPASPPRWPASRPSQESEFQEPAPQEPAYAAADHDAREHPTLPIPAPYGAPPRPEQRPGQMFTQQPHSQPGPYAGTGYPASEAYPQHLAPAVTAQPRQRRKVGMGLFAGSVLAAALVGGLAGGGSMALLDGDNGGSAPSSQTAPLVVNNTKSVNQITAAAAKAMPSVVTLSATSDDGGGTGSGIILDTDGHILTNTHVVTLDGATGYADIEVQTSDNRVFPGKIVGTDPLSDLAIVKIDAPNLVPATLGDSSQLNVGDTAIAIGSPLGLDKTVTDGIVSTLNRTIQVASAAVPETPQDSGEDSDDGNGFRFSPPGGGQSPAPQGTVNLNVIQTDAAINPGNSGGALVNADGAVIGVNVAIASAGGSSESGGQGNIGVGFSIPINHAKQVAQQIIDTGKATHGQLGVTVRGTSASGGSSAFSSGATVENVTPGSAADKAGVKKGDVILKLGERTISDAAELTAAVREQPGGATVKMEFTRGGKAESVDVTLETMPAS